MILKGVKKMYYMNSLIENNAQHNKESWTEKNCHRFLFKLFTWVNVLVSVRADSRKTVNYLFIINCKQWNNSLSSKWKPSVATRCDVPWDCKIIHEMHSGTVTCTSSITSYIQTFNFFKTWYITNTNVITYTDVF